MTDIPVEVTTQYATTVDELHDAWAFVMAHVDKVGPNPSIKISPIWSYGVIDMDHDESDAPRRFEVAVSGMVQASDG